MGRCTAKTQRGRRCKAAAVSGKTRCMFHGGKASTGRTFRKTRGKRVSRK